MTTGVFAEDDWTLGRLVLTGGARADRWTISDGFYRASGTGAANNSFADRSDWQFSGRVGALYRISDALALRGAARSEERRVEKEGVRTCSSRGSQYQ